jgi:hypothetical protein
MPKLKKMRKHGAQPETNSISCGERQNWAMQTFSRNGMRLKNVRTGAADGH